MAEERTINPLLSAMDLQERLGISREHAYNIIRAGGFKLGRRWYITERMLELTLMLMRDRKETMIG